MIIKFRKIIVSIIFLTMFININYTKTYADKMYNFKNITAEDGMSQSTAETIIQDKNGYIWIGTNDGLNKYNGYEMKVYRHDNKNKNSLVNSYIVDLKEDEQGNIWIGTANGVSKLDPNTDKITNYTDEEDSGNLSHRNTGEILIRSNGDVLLGTTDGLNIYNKEEDRFERILEKNLINQNILSLTEDNSGNLWIGTEFGLEKIDKELNNVIHYDIGKDTNEKDVKKINDVKFDEFGYIWASSDNDGLYKINIKTNKITKYENDKKNSNSLPSNVIRDVTRDSLGNLWVGTGEGLALYRPETDDFSVFINKIYDNSSIVGNNIYSIMEDRNGLLWIGTYTGISVMEPRNKMNLFRHDPLNENTISSNVIHGVYEDDEDMLWIGTNSDGLNIVDEINRKVIRLNASEGSISDNNIKDITGKGDYIVIATRSGLNIIDKKNETIDIYTKNDGLLDDLITTVFIDDKNNLWIGSPDGVNIMDLETKKIIDVTYTIEKYTKNDMYVKSIYQDERGYYWIGGFLDEGLLRLDPQKKETKLFNRTENDESTISSNTIRVIQEDSKGNLWIGTSYGLNKFNYDTEEFESYTTLDGLSNNIIYSILFDEDDNPWVSTNMGITKFNISENRFEKFNISDGLQGNEFNGNAAFKRKNGDFLFGGINGINLFDPNELSSSQKTEEVKFDEFEVKGNKYKDINNKEFNYSDNLISVKLFVPVFENDNIQYMYKMQGLEDEWRITNSNEINYGGLTHGEYELLVKYRDDNGRISEESSVKFTIKSPPWLSNSALVLYIIIIIIAVYKQLNRVKELNKKVAEKTRELNEEMEKNNKLLNRIIDIERIKNNYFVNLSHELRTPLNVMYTTEQLINVLNAKEEGIKKEDVNKYMSVMNRNIKRLLNLINNIIDTSKIENGNYRLNIKKHNIVYVVEEATLSLSEYIRSKNIDLIIDTDIEEKMMACDAYEIERCIVNLVSNSAKFTKEGGYIKVFIYDLGDQVKIVVEDNGIGISKENQDTVFDRFKQVIDKESEVKGGSGLGLSITKNIIEMHGGTIELESEIGQGCKFTIIL